MNIKEAITKVVAGKNLTEGEMYTVMGDIMSGETTSAQISSFLTGLRMKGETVDEITAAVRVMREKAAFIDSGVDIEKGEILLDTCGTGGDCSGTFNVSTASAFVAAGCGIVVAKHGNRSVSSSCGSADVLEAAGVNLGLTPEQVGQCVRGVGIGFLFAPALHGAMKYAIGPRREIGIRTIFNILGPMTNPAGANVQVMGVFAEELTETLAEVLMKLGSLRALVVHGEGGLDELTTTGETRITELKDGKVQTYNVKPEDLGLKKATIDQLQGGKDSMESAEIMKAVLKGDKGPKRDMVLLNSGAALMAAGHGDNLKAGIVKAEKCIDSGRAMAKLDELVDYTRKFE